MLNMRILVGLLILPAFGPAQHTTTVVFEGLQRSNPGASVDHGYVAAWALDPVHRVTLYAPDGHPMFQVSSFELPDGTHTNVVLSVAIDSDGTSAYVYQAASGMRSGIAILDTNGNQIRVIEMEPYEPSQVCFAPDHSLWTFGEQWKNNAPSLSDFMTFRHYLRDGKLLGSFVPRSALPDWQGGGLDQVVGPVVGHWRLRASKDRIGAALFIGASKQTWVELNLDGQLLGQWTYSTLNHEAGTPAAFDSNGKLYGERWEDGKPAGISVFERSEGSWQPISLFSKGHLLGADGVRLVFQSGDALQWIEIDNEGSGQSAAVTQH